MKYLYLLISALILSCEDVTPLKSNFRVNHYQQSAIGVAPQLVLLIQEGDKVGTTEWKYFYDEIKGFDYEWGYIYDLNVSKTTIENPPADGSSVAYELIDIVSKTKVNQNVKFEVSLKSETKGYDNIVKGNLEEGFKLGEDLNINCDHSCNELAESLANQKELTGVFTHSDHASIELKELLLK